MVEPMEPVAWRWRDIAWRRGEWSYGPSEPFKPDDRWKVEPLYTRPSPPADAEIEALVERLNAAAQENMERAWARNDAHSLGLGANLADAAASALTRLAGERDESRVWAEGWHKAVETAEVLLGIGPCLAADEFPAAVQANVAASASRIRELEAERDRLRKALEWYSDDLFNDKGKIARAALNPPKEGEG